MQFLQDHKKALKLIAQTLLVVLIVWLIYRRLEHGFYEAADVLVGLHWQLFMAVGLFTAAVVVSGILWGGIVKQIAPEFRRIPLAESIRVHTVSWLLKYVPGQVGTLISKMAWGRKNNLAQKVVVSSLLYENIFLASSSLLLAIPAIGLTAVKGFGNDMGLLIPLLSAIAIMPLLIPRVFTSTVNAGLKLIRRKPFDSRYALSGKQVMSNQLLFLAPRIINGLGFVLIASLFFTPTVLSAAQLIGAYALAGIIGILAVFVPSGLGVREAVIIITAGPIIGLESAAAVAIIARVCATAADVILGLIYFVMRINDAE